MIGRSGPRATGDNRIMRTPLVILASLAALALAHAAGAQPTPPATPDAATHPQLAAMKAWLDDRSPEARQCALRGGLFLDADRHFRDTRSEERALDALMKQAAQLNPAERDRMRTIGTQVVSMAAALSMFDADTAAVAFAQMCMTRAQRPGFEPPPGVIRAQLERATQCQAQHAVQTLDRKECVARAFRLQ
jgi:hypothetical protein